MHVQQVYTHTRYQINRLKKSSLVTGTLLLTTVGLLCRLIGFFYRIFLAQAFGEEGMGIYQLTAPIIALVFSLSAAGLQTAVSRLVASYKQDTDKRFPLRILFCGCVMSCLCALCCTGIVYHYSDKIAISFLQEARCAPLLRIVALSFPFSAIHSISRGYFFGIQNTRFPAGTQLLEQLVRVSSVYGIYTWLTSLGKEPTIAVAVLGIVLEESISCLVSVLVLGKSFGATFQPFRNSQRKTTPSRHPGNLKITFQLCRVSFPITLNRIALTFLQSMEAIYIPSALKKYGMLPDHALRTYGVLTGMALPFILFPSTLIGSVCMLLLPRIAFAQSADNDKLIRRTVSRAIHYSSLFGILCTAFFLLSGRLAGEYLFHSKQAGSFILTLSFICPFLYITSTLASILNGLGRTGSTFLLNMIGLLVRLLFVFFAIPHFGIRGYLWGLLASELLLTGFEILAVRYFTQPGCMKKRGIL